VCDIKVLFIVKRVAFQFACVPCPTQLACKTPELKAHVEAWAKKKEEVEAFVSVHRNGGDSSDDFEEEEEKEKPLENADKLCSTCNPSASGR